MPIMEIWHQATSSPAAASVFMVLLLIAAIVALIAVQQTASRLTWSLGRDNAFLFSTRFLGVVNPALQVPVYALMFNSFVVFIIGFIYLGSTSAFNAFIATGLILQQTTYAIPAALLMVKRCRKSSREEVLPRNRPFRLPSIVGWTVNIATVVFAVIVMVFYNFPAVVPVTGSSMSKFPFCGMTLSGLTIS
jgi:choline transport protein